MSKAAAIKAALNERIAEITSPDFVAEHISRHVSSANGVQHRVVENNGLGAATIEFRYSDGQAVFAKLYPEGDPLGPYSYEKLVSLREAGLGDGSGYQVVEPLGWYDERNLMLTRGATGQVVASLLGGENGTLSDASRAAARWLAHLHKLPVRIGRPKPMIEASELFPMARRLAKVAAQNPTMVKPLLERMKQLERLSEETIDGVVAHTHGQFRPIHVFLDGDLVTVIDIDRGGPGDPARDAAEFVHRLRTMTFARTGQVATADEPTAAFVDEYRANVPADFSHNLAFHWGRFVLHSLHNQLKDKDSDNAAEVEARLPFYQAEFEGILAGRFLR
jgi:hypothetical protein